MIFIIMPTKEYMQEYRSKRKALALNLLGDKCAVCGTKEQLQFDHKDPHDKVNEIASMLTSRMEDFLIEVGKCQLLCYACHLKKTLKNGDGTRNRASWKHGVSGYVNHKCRCEVCKSAQKKYKTARRLAGLKT